MCFGCPNLWSGNMDVNKMDGEKVANNTAKSGEIYARHKEQKK